jgi:predicted HicB family RNase H-like nuclease
MRQRKTANFNLRMDPKLKADAEKAAAEDRRSLASLTAALLARHCKEREQDSPKRGGRK